MNILEREKAIDKLVRLIRQSKHGQSDLDIERHVSTYLTAFLKRLASTDEDIAKTILKRCDVFEEYLQRVQK